VKRYGRLLRWAVAACLAALALEAALGVYLVGVPADGLDMRRLYSRLVEDTTDPAVFNARASAMRPMPLRAEDVRALRAWVHPAWAAGADDRARVIALRGLVHHAFPIGPEVVGPRVNPVPELVRAIAAGTRPSEALCGTFARVLVAAVRVAGLEARLLHIRPALAGPGTPWPDPETGHYTTEVFLPSEGGWVVMDSFYNAHFRLDGSLAGALALHQAMRDPPRGSGRVIEVVQGQPQRADMDAHTLLPYFARLSVRVDPLGDPRRISGLRMLLGGERGVILAWQDAEAVSPRAWDALSVWVFVVLGIGLAAGVVLLARGRGAAAVGKRA
jgi:hypothetical protein